MNKTMNVKEIAEQISKLPPEQQAEAKKLFAKTYGVTLDSFTQERVLKVPRRLVNQATRLAKHREVAPISFWFRLRLRLSKLLS